VIVVDPASAAGTTGRRREDGSGPFGDYRPGQGRRQGRLGRILGWERLGQYARGVRSLVVFVAVMLGGPSGAAALDCEHEDALARAAASLLLDGGARSPGAIERALRRAGSDAPAAHALMVADDDAGRLGAWLSEQRERADAPLACGEAQGRGRRLVLATARGGSLAVEGRRIRGRLAAGFDRPEVVVSDASGATRRVGLSASALADGVTLPDGIAEPVRVQLVAYGPRGPRPVAERTVGEGAPLEPSPGTGDVPRRVRSLRRSERAPALRSNRLLAGAAARHAARVCAGGRVAHELEPGLDPEARLRRAGVRARSVGEVVARAASPGAAMDALVRSPSHRLALLDRRFTDAGIGRARADTGHTCVVVLLAAWPRYVGR